MLDRMLGFYSTKTPVTKAMELMFEPKPADKTWTEYFQYLVNVAEKSGCPGAFVLQCVCDSATSDTKKTMLTNLDKDRPDAMRHAWELVAFAVEYDSADCPSGPGSGGEKVSLAVGRADKSSSGTGESWILDRGSSVHLVSDSSLLRDAERCSDTCAAANGSPLNVTCKGTPVIRTVVDGVIVEVNLTNVYFCKEVTSNIISYASLEEKGAYLVRRGDMTYVANASSRFNVRDGYYWLTASAAAVDVNA
ncbi:hypothetical protein PR001_g12948 [Phytophthora rubi]|nr:hypothetical protein PR001_g12948 [Phytophthora rubi]